jgi:hypothetical protein
VADFINYDIGTSYGIINISSSTQTTSDGFRWQSRQVVVQQKGESFAFQITDIPDGSGSGGGAHFTGLTLGIVGEHGPVKLPAGQSF